MSDAGLKLVRRQYFQLIPYQVLLIVVNAVNGIVDGIVASNLIGKTAMTAIGMFGPFNHLLYAVSMMLVSGAQILCGRYMGKNQGKEMRNTFTVDLVLSMLISMITMGLMIAGALLNWTRVFGVNEQELAALNSYFLGQAIGIPGLVLGQQLFAFLSMENETRRTTTATLFCVFSNVVFDILFVYVMHLGTFGLALGTAVSVWCFFGIMALWYLRNKPQMLLSPKEIDWNEAKNIVVLGYPGSISRFVEMFRCIIVNGLILQYVGSVGLSSFAASNSVMAIFWSLPFGMFAVQRMLHSVSIGEEDRKGTLDIMHVITRWGALFVLCVAIAVCLLAEPFTRLFFQDPADPVYGMTVMALRILPFCMVFSVIGAAFSIYAQIIQDKLFATLYPILDGAVHVVIFSFLLIPVMGMNGCILPTFSTAPAVCWSYFSMRHGRSDVFPGISRIFWPFPRALVSAKMNTLNSLSMTKRTFPPFQSRWKLSASATVSSAGKPFSQVWPWRKWPPTFLLTALQPPITAWKSVSHIWVRMCCSGCGTTAHLSPPPNRFSSPPRRMV